MRGYLFGTRHRNHIVAAIHEMNLLLKSLPVLLPVATAWVEREERKILRNGIPLTPDGLQDAAKMGVAARMSAITDADVVFSA